jgi:cation diffusion facilitator CzcD-associated flavoprotein CzcO
VRVDRVSSEGDLLVVRAGERSWRTRTLVNATGTWTSPFVPYYRGIEEFAGEHWHTADYPGAERFAGKRVLGGGGGASAVQFLGERAPIAETIWVTRREPRWRDDFDEDAGRQAVALVEERVLDQATIQREAEGVDGVVSAYAIRSRHAGDRRFAELTIAVDGLSNVASAHRIADQVEDRLRDNLQLDQVTVHVEPC